ncbi:MAG: Txe/YoeB family addiction module toxin [Candidatus Puniceispirillum sp.]|nr:Txe/YoeB family addiction module toxin [Candidatus Puniceispirillum sp.]
MRKEFAEAWEDYLFWQKTDKAILKRINALFKDMKRDPFNGSGKPEPLKYDLAGYWSRRINTEHRVVYKVANETIVIVQCRYHY